MAGRLFVCVGHGDETGFGPGVAEELQTDRKVAQHVTHWDSDGGKTRSGGQVLAVVAVRGVEIADEAWRIGPRRINHGIEPMLLELPSNSSS